MKARCSRHNQFDSECYDCLRYSILETRNGEGETKEYHDLCQKLLAEHGRPVETDHCYTCTFLRRLIERGAV